MTCARTGWTDTSDSNAGCNPTTYAVADGEEIARLLHSKNSDPPKERLKRDELFGHKKAPVSNVCNDPLGSSGASFVRCAGLSDDDLRQRSADYAASKAGRDPRGAIVGSAAALRAIRSKLEPERQVVFVYDDPTAADIRHCVVRVNAGSRAEGDFLRTEVLKALSRAVPQHPIAAIPA